MRDGGRRRQSLQVEVITLVKESGCPGLHSRKNIKKSAQVTLEGYGPVVQNVEVNSVIGGCKTLPIISLPSLLQRCFQDGKYLCQLVTKMHNQREMNGTQEINCQALPGKHG